MTAKTFIQRYGRVGINGPSYRGAKMPAFNETLINESAFSDELRCKDMVISLHDNSIYVDWISQEWNHNTKEFFDEVFRCYRYLAKVHNLQESIMIEISIYDRDGTGHAYKEKMLEV